MMGTPSRLSWLTSPNSSSEAPLFESRIATSSRSTMPRSPCSESTGWRNEAGVPVDVRVAASLRAISPDFPTPDTMSRPCAAASSRTAAANGGPNRPATRSIAAASRARTRRPRSTRSLGSVRDIATLHEVLGQEALPLAPRLEDQFRDLTRGAGGSKQPVPTAYVDVKPLEYDGVVQSDAQVHAVIGEHAVDVEADELQAAGERGVDHRAQSPRPTDTARAPPIQPFPARPRAAPTPCPSASGLEGAEPRVATLPPGPPPRS